MAKIRFTDDIQSCVLGPLPVVLPFLRKLQLREMVDALVPLSKRAEITHGQVFEALVLNRLLSPRALYAVSDWADSLAFGDVLQVNPQHLNDDRLMRTLEALYPRLEELQGNLAWHVMETFDLDVSFLHWDMTSFFFEGSYPEDDQLEQFPMIKYGKPKPQDAGKHRKQMQVGLATTSEEGIPLWQRTFSGNAAEVSQVSDVMEQLQKVTRTTNFTLIGDSKLLSDKNIAKAHAAGLYFLAPERRAAFPKVTYFEQRHNLQRMSLPRPATTQKVPVYFGFDQPVTWDVSDGQLTLRRLFIVSSEERRATRRNRKRRLKKFWEGVEKVRRNLGRYSYKTPEAALSKLETLLSKTDMEEVLHFEITGTGKEMELTIHKDVEAWKKLRQLDGVYTLLTNLPDDYDAESLLQRYKRQYLSEQRFASLKGPLQLRPIFLKKNQRIMSLVGVVTIALMAYCLLEYQVHKSIRLTNDPIPDLYTKRKAIRPTARRLLASFEYFTVTKQTIDGQLVYSSPPFTALQQQILDHLGIDAPLGFLE